MVRSFSIAALLLATACTAPVPDSNPTGFGRYTDLQSQRAIRDAQLSGEPISVGPRVSDETLSNAPTTVQDLGPVDLNASGVNNPTISDEQNFDAVSSRETIESDAERIAEARSQRQQVGIEALPERPQNTGPNIVEYALATSNSVGQAVYARSRTAASRTERNCNSYRSPDAAQAAFLAAGGPERDRQGLDPDGDGFACAWNPAPFRAARAPAAPVAPGAAIAADALNAIGQ